MNALSGDSRLELIEKLMPAVHYLTMRPGLFDGDCCESSDRFVAAWAVSYLSLRDPGPLQNMQDTDYIDVFLHGNNIRNCFYFIRSSEKPAVREENEDLYFDKSLTKREFLDSIYEQLKQMEDIGCFSKVEINELVYAVGNSLIDNEHPSVKTVLGSRIFLEAPVLRLPD